MQRKLLGALIAGGQSRRFGSDKALAEFDGRSLLDHVLAGLSPQTDSIVICGRSVNGYASLADRPKPLLGPLGGLAAALHFAATHGFQAVLTSACDTPEVPASLSELLAGDTAAVVVGQPLFGYWPASLSAPLDKYLARDGTRAVFDWAQIAGARRVRLTHDIPNVNTLSDLQALRLRRSLAA